MSLISRISALTLALTLSLAGMPLPLHAAGDEAPAVAGDRTLTFRGQPLWQFLGDAPTGRLGTSVLEQADGQIRGMLVNGDGQPLADQPVQLRRPSSEGRGRLTASTDATGAFSYTGLGLGRYEVEYLVEGDVIATSGRIDLVEGAMLVTGITVAPPASGLSRGAAGVPESNRNSGLSTGAKAGLIAAIAAAVVWGVIMVGCKGGRHAAGWAPCG